MDGKPVEAHISDVRSVADARSRVAVALGVDARAFVGIKLLNGAFDVCNDTPLDSLDKDAGLCVIVLQGAPEWYPREKYMHEGQEVLQITGEQGGEYSVEFVDGSSAGVAAAVYEAALAEWAWQEVSKDNRVWAHPPEKPEESGGWTSFFTSPKVRKTAITGAGVLSGFLVGVTGHTEGPDDGSDFSNAFRIAQVVGILAYAMMAIARMVSK